MPGFLITNTKKVPNLKNYDEKRCLKTEFQYKEWTISRNTLNKFVDDKLFFETDSKIVILDGVILNKQELIEAYNSEDFKTTILKMMEVNSEFFAELRGPFSGAIYDKETNKWTCFTDQLGNKLVLYYANNEDVIIGSQLNYITDCMKLNGIERTLSKDWMNDLSYFGYVIDTHSIVKGVSRVFAGDYMIIDKGNVETKSYYKITKKPDYNITVDEAMKLIDDSFTNAVKRVIDKAIEYDNKVVVDISAGLDSRIITKIASKINKDILLGLNYSQSGSVDYTIPRKVANINNIDMVQYPMDKGNCLKDIDDIIFMNNGMNYYMGITGGKRALERVDGINFSLELWGMLGDMNEGAFVVADDLSELDWKYDRHRVSKRLSIPDDFGYKRTYPDRDIMWLYIRGLIAGQNTAFIRQNFLEAPVVFGDVEFLEVMYKIPYEMRTKQKIFKKWLINYYPDMAAIKYGSTGVAVTESDMVEKIKRIPVRGKSLIKKSISKKYRNHMAPSDYWYESNAELRAYLDNYYEENKKYVEDFEELKEITSLYYNEESNMPEKSIALSMISAVKQYIA